MYRIRTYNSDGTLGGFWSNNGLVDDPAQAKTYQSIHEAQDDLVKVHNYLGLSIFPKLNYDISTTGLAQQEAESENKSTVSVAPMSVNQFLVTTQPLPPFEDKPSRSFTVLPSPEVLDFDGGSALSSQDLDVDAGGSS